MILIIRVSHLQEKDKWEKFRTQNFKNTRQIIICGKEDIEENYVLEGDVLYLKCRDKWEDLPEKMIAAYNAILDIKEFDNYTSFLKIDSDIIPTSSFNPSHICQLTKKSSYIGGHLRKPAIHQHGIYHLKKNLSNDSPWKGKKYSNKEMLSCTFALGGLGYVVTRKCLQLICEKYKFANLNSVKYEFIYEDAMVGIILKRHGINPVKYNIGLRDTRSCTRPNRKRRIPRTMSQVRAGINQPKYPRRRNRNGSVPRQKK